MTLDEMTEIANSPTRARRKAEAMGFRFGRATVREENYVCASWSSKTWAVRIDFKCVCGREETGMYFFGPSELLTHESLLREQLDIVAFLFRHGSFSFEHLINDGYTSEEADAIVAKGQRFDMENPQ